MIHFKEKRTRRNYLYFIETPCFFNDRTIKAYFIKVANKLHCIGNIQEKRQKIVILFPGFFVPVIGEDFLHQYFLLNNKIKFNNARPKRFQDQTKSGKDSIYFISYYD